MCVRGKLIEFGKLVNKGEWFGGFFSCIRVGTFEDGDQIDYDLHGLNIHLMHNEKGFIPSNMIQMDKQDNLMVVSKNNRDYYLLSAAGDNLFYYIIE